MRVTGGRKQENLAHAETRIAEAAQAGAQVILLPEALNLGWTDPSAAQEAELIPDGESCRRLSALARQHAVYVCAGLIERNGGRVFNSAVLLGPDGRLLLHHHKINELEIGQPYYS